MNSPSYCLQKMLWQYTYEIYINTLIAIIYFLSKHHLQGGDREQHSKIIALVNSIHTTRKVVTNVALSEFGFEWISIHTTRKVVTVDERGKPTAFVFQSTPPARWWQKEIWKEQVLRRFQSTPPARWWHIGGRFAWAAGNFNPHHPQGGDIPHIVRFRESI